MKFFAARHGETLENASNIVQGHLPGELSPKGIKQAEELARQVEELKPDTIFTSDLRRCLQTTERVHKLSLQSVVLRDWRLRERHFGQLEGGVSVEIDWDGFWSVGPDEEPYAAESEGRFLKRVSSFVVDLSGLFTKSNISVAICHGGVLNKLSFLQDRENFQPNSFANAVLYEFDLEKILKNVHKSLNFSQPRTP